MSKITRRSLFGVLAGVPVAGALSVTGGSAQAVNVVEVHNQSSAASFEVVDGGSRIEAGRVIQQFILRDVRRYEPMPDIMGPIEEALRRAR